MRASHTITLLAAALVACMVVSGCTSRAERHEDGQGAIEFSPGAAERIVNGTDLPNADWSYGLFLCTPHPEDPPLLVDVQVTGLVGGAKYLGARYVPSPWAIGDAMGADDGFPPADIEPGAMHEVTGQALAAPCDEGAYPAQVMIGIRLSPDGDGGITGEEVTYDHGGRRRTLVLHNTFVFCGPNTTTVDHCTPDGAPTGRE